MKVKELIEKLQKLDPEMLVYTETDGCLNDALYAEVVNVLRDKHKGNFGMFGDHEQVASGGELGLLIE